MTIMTGQTTATGILTLVMTGSEVSYISNQEGQTGLNALILPNTRNPPGTPESCKTLASFLVARVKNESIVRTA
ncbi:hypothetical protein P7K49_023603 [Saguinus oedipus]|uniref:Uncharacterized protein n=1 Tax=Saguinus oedipus TaxID=9490 RepID=A0ABQ9UPE8_SAGOE|nr:hypothetical protein P7K49_023603 [Saguinus oedipus]